MSLGGIRGARLPNRCGHTGGVNAEHLVAASREAGVRSSRVLEAVARVPRERFVPPGYGSSAYVDEPIPITKGQVTSQPSLIARMVETLALEGHERVLEVGTGYGWQTALLATLAESVWSVERFPQLADEAARNLEAAGLTNARVLTGDGTEGLPEHGPFDGIIVSAAFPEVPQPLADQLVSGGRLVQPLGSGGSELVVAFVKTPDGLERSATLTGARFVRLVGRHGFGR